MITAPIWKDIIYASTADTLDYYIKSGDDIIFNGRAIKAPDAPVIEINVSKVCRDSLMMNMVDFSIWQSGIIEHPKASGTFEIYDSSNDTALESYLFVYNYGSDEIVSGAPLSEPINNHTDSRMKVLYTQFADRITTIEVRNE